MLYLSLFLTENRASMKKRIVLADDDTITRLDLKESLEGAGYEVAGEADDGFDAIELCHKLNPDIVLLDIKMPMLDGLSAAKILYEEGAKICVVMLTAYSDENFVKKAGDFGVMGYIVKPVPENSLAPTIEIAWKRYNELLDAQKEIQKKERELKQRKTIERAKGIIMSKQNMDEKSAYAYMRKVSMNKLLSMDKVAEIIIMSDSIKNK